MGENYRQYISLTATERVQYNSRRAAWPGQAPGPLGPEHSAFGKAALPQLHRARDQEQQGPSSAP